MFWFFGREACGILAPQPGVEPTPPALEGEVLTTGPPGKSPHWLLTKIKLPLTHKGRIWKVFRCHKGNENQKGPGGTMKKLSFPQAAAISWLLPCQITRSSDFQEKPEFRFHEKSLKCKKLAPCSDLKEEEIQKRGDICKHIADSLCCTAETNTTL